MKINGLNGINAQPEATRMTQATDSTSKNIQNQIANAQKKLQDLSSNEEMTIEEKMKKRQEIQQEITSLNQQLRQHQMEQRKEKQVKSSSVQDMTKGAKTTEGGKGSGLSQASMQAMVSAGSSLKQAKVQGSVATRMEGTAGILESEIKLDAQRGMDTKKKEEELADVQQKVQETTASQLETLADVGENMQEAAQTDQQNSDSSTKAEEKDNKVNKGGEIEASTEEAIEEKLISKTVTYTPIDVYL